MSRAQKGGGAAARVLRLPPPPNKPRWGHKIKRATGAFRVARLVKKMREADEGKSSPEERERARRALYQVLSSMRGVPMKMGQLFASNEEDDPLRELLDNIDPLPLEEIIPVLDHEWGRPFGEILSVLEPAQFAASLGQVHPGNIRALNGNETERVAVKVQYPGVRENVRAEMFLLGMVPKAGPIARYGFDLQGYKKTLSENMERELDYLTEAVQQERFRAECTVEGLSIARVYPEYCTRNVLVQEWLEGESISVARTYPLSVRLRIGQTILRTLFKSIFETGLVHGDPHAGNYRFTPEGEVLLYDFGCVIEVDKPRAQALLGLVLRMREGESFRPLDYWKAMGFSEEKLLSIEEALAVIGETLLEPFLSPGVFAPENWKLSERFEEALGPLRWWFRAAGPADLLLLLRAFQGAIAFLGELDVKLPWWAVLKATLSVETFELAAAFEPEPVASGVYQIKSARHLRVELARGEAPLSFCFPASEARHLSQLVAPELLAPSEQELLRKAEEKVETTGLCPGLLAWGRSKDGPYRIWLE